MQVPSPDRAGERVPAESPPLCASFRRLYFAGRRDGRQGAFALSSLHLFFAFYVNNSLKKSTVPHLQRRMLHAIISNTFGNFRHKCQKLQNFPRITVISAEKVWGAYCHPFPVHTDISSGTGSRFQFVLRACRMRPFLSAQGGQGRELCANSLQNPSFS